ncbi:hypothetical protein M408DRAFT_325784 [Serendipita vermifera MAFF 305830]|uniref:tRNA (uracil-O(2)-)-methyltransferase n=1 Tax=Serendipita vermifera MAFF 305830 TaxID=933852 RepID=A0A0C3BQJ8_SERVB|nr:hypothetical protein M408DRAFT_325784 [Serendipita vermifera MAFF 305830]
MWLGVAQCTAHFPAELFEGVMMNLILHAELTVGLVLRTEVVPLDSSTSTSDTKNIDKSVLYEVPGYTLNQVLRRRLLPKVPERDASLEQDCILYRDDSPDPDVTLVTLFPLLQPGQKMPHYHPDVDALAFRYLPSKHDAAPPLVRVDVVPRNSASRDEGSRLYKTCVTLLEIIDKHGWGLLTGYSKRMIHDTVVPRNTYQDFYHVMKKKYQHLKEEWVESTDAVKNVFEDIGIATFLMLLWRDTYPPVIENNQEKWGRPPGGFVDAGCGAGLLVHILLSEGYQGIGLDIRARKSWDTYPTSTRSRLHVCALDPLSPGFPPKNYFPPGIFLIGNHADELTPWLPVTAALVPSASYISIPCCPWSFDKGFHRASSIFPSFIEQEDKTLKKRLGNTSSSTYGAYLCWLSALTKECGFQGEYEALRIPSTRNWCIIGRYKLPGHDGTARASQLLAEVVNRGLFKTRKNVAAGH